MNANRTLAEKPRTSRVWLWLLALPLVGISSIAALLTITWVLLTKDIEKSPGYALATATITSHAGVVRLLGAPVRVTGIKAKNITKKPTSTSLELTFELSGSAGQATAEVSAYESGGRWTIPRATIASGSDQFGLLADGGLQPLYAPRAELAGAP